MSGQSGVVEFERPSGSTTAADHHVPLEADLRWHLANRVASSRGFAKSKLLTSFLLYICEKYLLDQPAEITEQQIGEHVFRRPPGYNPGEDNIVRSYARLLRQRLDEYFTSEGLNETIRIVVPRGGYVPLFIEKDRAIGENKTQRTHTEAMDFDALPTPVFVPAVLRRNVRSPLPSTWILRGACVILAMALLSVVARNAHMKSPQTSVADRFWSVFFIPTRDTLVVPADCGLVIYQNLTNKRVSLAEYASGEYLKQTAPLQGLQASVVNDLGGRRYTSVVDLNLVSSISQLPFVVKNRFKVRYAREVTLDDLKQSNVILLGSIDSNPWVQLFQKDLNFQFEPRQKIGEVVIHNLHPKPGESDFYETDRADPARGTFGVIAVTPNLDGTGHVLLIEGINMAGTEAAAEYLFNDASSSLLNQVFDSKGVLLSFEVLIRTSNIGANAARPKIIAQRILHN